MAVTSIYLCWKAVQLVHGMYTVYKKVDEELHTRPTVVNNSGRVTVSRFKSCAEASGSASAVFAPALPFQPAECIVLDYVVSSPCCDCRN